MAKLDWGKASQSTHDPARVQRTNDFLTPDPVIVSTTKAVPRKLTLAQKEKRRRKAERKAAAKLAALAAKMAEKAKTKAKAKAKTKARSGIQHSQRRLKVEARIAARIAADEATKLTPEYIAAQEAEKAQIAWIEQERRAALIAEREPLRQKWRDQLLKR